MKQDRNINGTGRGKYGLIKTRRLAEIIEAGKAAHKNYIGLQEKPFDSVLNKLRDQMDESSDVARAVAILENAGVLDWGPEGTEGEFFVIKLKDENARMPLHTYAHQAGMNGDDDLARDVFDLAMRAGDFSPFCKKPD